jgi:hypothetical protein
MANTYSSGTFVIDTSTNVAGLTALKGSAPALTDHICVANSTGPVPTLTVEQDLSCASLNIGFGAVNGGSASKGALVVDNGVTITVANTGRFCVSYGSPATFNGRPYSLGTSNGSADQTFTSWSPDVWGVRVNGVPWRRVRSLTGWVVDIAADSTGTTITLAEDARMWLLGYGQTFEVRDKTTGALIGTRKCVGNPTATSITIDSALSVTAGQGIYIPIAATDQVYELTGTTVKFGDGSASAWNNNGGAIPPSGAAITTEGIVMKPSVAQGYVEWYSVYGDLVATDTAFIGTRQSSQFFAAHLPYSPKVQFDRCSFAAWGYYAFSAGIGASPKMTGCVFMASTTNAAVFNAAADLQMTDCLATTGSGNGYVINNTGGATLTRCKARGAAQYAYGWWIASASTDVSLIDCEATNAATYALIIQDGCKRVRIVRGVYTPGGSANAIYCRGSDDIVLVEPVLNTPTAAVWTWRANTAVYRASVPGGGQVFSDNLASGRSVATGVQGTTPYLYAYFPNRTTDATVGYAGGAVYLTTKDAWVSTNPLYVPGLASYGATALGGYTLNGATVQTQYRVSHDNGRTWTEWADLPATITDTPDRDREYIQFRVRKTDSGTGVPSVGYVRVAVAFDQTWQWKERPEGLRIQAVEGGLG